VSTDAAWKLDTYWLLKFSDRNSWSKERQFLFKKKINDNKIICLDILLSFSLSTMTP
jgi:hypothetical protein